MCSEPPGSRPALNRRALLRGAAWIGVGLGGVAMMRATPGQAALPVLRSTGGSMARLVATAPSPLGPNPPSGKTLDELKQMPFWQVMGYSDAEYGAMSASQRSALLDAWRSNYQAYFDYALANDGSSGGGSTGGTTTGDSGGGTTTSGGSTGGTTSSGGTSGGDTSGGSTACS